MKYGMARSFVVASVLTAASSASALTILPSGEVQGWGITPFTDLSQGAVVTNLAPGVTSYLQNDWAPIDYPNGIGHQPSPGGSAGEPYDLEEMHIRKSGDTIEMLLVASSLFEAGSVPFVLGDLVLDIDDDPDFDIAMITTLKDAGLSPGNIYKNITVSNDLQDASGSYHGTGIEPQATPWQVTGGMLAATETIMTASHDYGGDENNTYIYEFVFDFSDPDLGGSVPDSLAFHMAWGCGNDVISGTYVIPGEGEEPIDGVPEPTTAVLGLMGLSGLCGAVRRRGRRLD